MKIDASIILNAKYDQSLMEQGMLQATGYPAAIADFYSAISGGGGGGQWGGGVSRANWEK